MMIAVEAWNEGRRTEGKKTGVGATRVRSKQCQDLVYNEMVNDKVTKVE